MNEFDDVELDFWYDQAMFIMDEQQKSMSALGRGF